MRISTIILFIPLLYGCSRSVYTEKGNASYYAEDFNGKRTANGEIFNMNEMTAAHKKLAFNTLVKVTNLKNGKEVVVRINDRGPFVKGRIIDLSKGAAQKIGMIGDGHALVNLKVVDKNSSQKDDNDTPPTKISKNKKDVYEGTYDVNMNRKNPQGYAVQIGSFEQRENANDIIKKVNPKTSEPIFIQVSYVRREKVYRVLAGNINDKKQTEKLKKTLKREGFKGIVVRHKG